MKTELLVQMDGLARSPDLVFVLAASNLPWSAWMGASIGQLGINTHTPILPYRELDHAMLRRLEKRILVDLPNTPARCAMFRHHLPQVLSHSPLAITTEIDYNSVAEVCVCVCVCVCVSSQK